MAKFALLNIDRDLERLSRRSRLLENSGFSIFKAANIPEALESIRSDATAVIVLAAELAAEDGCELSRLLKGQVNPPRILQISSRACSVDDHARALENGADGFLCEPVSP